MKHTVTAVTILGTLFTIAFLVVQGYRLERDVDSWIDRAQVGADREDIIEYVRELQKNMERYGMTRGHTALIFKKPINDMALHYRAVQRIIERLESIKGISKNETAYQVALDDIRGVIRELPNPAHGWLWVKYGWWLILVCIVLWVITVMSWHFSESHRDW